VDAQAQLSDAERVARLERSLDADTMRVADLTMRLSGPASDYAKLEQTFQDLTAQLDAARKRVTNAEASGDPETRAAIQAETTDLEKKWNLAKERFQLALDERKVQQANIAALEEKIVKDRQALDKLKGIAVPAASEPAATAPTELLAGNVPSAQAVAPPTASPAIAVSAAAPTIALQPASAGASSDSKPATVDNATLVAAREASVANAPAAEAKAAASVDAATAAPAEAPVKPATKELAAATDAATKTAAAAQAAQEEAHSISERMAILHKNIELERSLRDVARRKSDIAEEDLRALNEELQTKLSAGQPIGTLRRQVSEAMERLRNARNESRRVATHLDDLQTELGHLQADQLIALEEARAKADVADKARQKVDDLNNPFTARNLLAWLLTHGLRGLGIFLSVGAFVYLARVSEARLVRLMVPHDRHGRQEERENRAKTLVSVFRNAANIVTISGGVVMILDEIGLPIGPLLGGAAVAGLAVAFGAQSLIKDYFTGFMVLSEQQYMINDVIKIGDISGQVERITLRMTVLRDLEGNVHFLPHGQINTVTNMTLGWSRAVFEVGVAYKENIDRVIDVLLELGRGLRRDSQFGRLILEDPTMLGVDELAKSAVVVKFFIKTKPLQQWAVKRELLRRIKNKFDELDIEIPFPHLMLYHRDLPAPANLESSSIENWAKRDVA
jgi:small conductance mechanosensitive channel